CHQHNRYPWTF
nr:immunoglobulin light chain junction region [Macaca mulatta]MOV64981.1 immunoglobulin light chain junction region [Macaca mulatta]MOV65025.1 immunoglobulin light chain junction region [Macaca mulatta]